MGNIHPNIHAGSMTSRRPSNSSTVNSSRYGEATTSRRATGQVCLSTFILGGPMPPTPGLVPLCWEDLIDWTDDATEITEQVYQKSIGEDTLKNILPASGLEIETIRGTSFVPYVSMQATDSALKKLASQSYMERAQFYQESVVIAVKSHSGNDVDDQDEVLSLISLFQFSRYYTLLRRLHDSQSLVLEYQPSGASLEEALSSIAPKNGEEHHNKDDDVREGGSFMVRRRLSDSSSSSSSSSTSSLGEDNNNNNNNDHGQQQQQHMLQLQDCVICLEKTEDSVLHCCGQAICRDCERRWVRKRLACPFCRRSFASVKEAIQTQWQLSSAIPVQQVIEDMMCLGEKMQSFWVGLGIDQRKTTTTTVSTTSSSIKQSEELTAILEENYVQRPKTIQTSTVIEEEDDGDGNTGDGFVLIDSLAEFLVDA